MSTKSSVLRRTTERGGLDHLPKKTSVTRCSTPVRLLLSLMYTLSPAQASSLGQRGLNATSSEWCASGMRCSSLPASHTAATAAANFTAATSQRRGASRECYHVAVACTGNQAELLLPLQSTLQQAQGKATSNATQIPQHMVLQLCSPDCTDTTSTLPCCPSADWLL
jgi:hypothetical protein